MLNFLKKILTDEPGGHTFVFIPEDISQKTVRSIATKTSCYQKRAKEIFYDGQIDHPIYQFKEMTVDVLLVPDNDILKVMYGDIQIGIVPKHQTNHALFATQADYKAIAKLTGGPYKIVTGYYDDHGHPSYHVDKFDEDIKVKVSIDY